MTKRSSGFSLIEILAATVILIFLVLMLSQVFHQSSVSWDSGLRKATGNMTGRAVMGLMSRELMCAVLDKDIFQGTFEISSGNIKFMTLNKPPMADARIARLVQYRKSGFQIERSYQEKTASDNYYSWSAPGHIARMATNVESLLFYTPAGWSSGSGTLPKWVRIELKIKRDADVSGIKAWSLGPDGTNGTPISSW